MTDDRTEPNRWAVLALLGIAQLMVVLDATIVNVALPSAQKTLHFSTESRQWVITAYALAFGSLLLLGGKLGDLFGRKYTFIAGLIGFSVASAIGGLAQSFGVLVGARALQGIFGALLAPSALGLLTVAFAGSPDRPKAFGIFGAIAGAGGSVGLLLGGILTQLLSWRWCLYVNLLFAIPTAIMAWRVLVHTRHPTRPRLDMPGVVAATAGLFLFVFGFSSAETDSWTSAVTILSLVGSGILLTSFVLLERTSDHPLLPLHIVLDRARGGAYASMALAGAGIFGVFIFITFYLQNTKGFTPIQTGVGFLPMNFTIITTATTAQTRVMGRTGPKPLIVTGMTCGLLAMLFFTRITPDTSYWTHVFPGLIVLGFGMGCIFAPTFSTATLGVKPQEAGVASAMVNTSQQVGGSIGTAILSTIFASAVTAYGNGHRTSPSVGVDAPVHGYTTAFYCSAVIFVIGLLVALWILPRKEALAAPIGAPAGAGAH